MHRFLRSNLACRALRPIQPKRAASLWRRDETTAVVDSQYKTNYDANGYLLLPSFLNQNELGILHTEIDQLLSQASSSLEAANANPQEIVLSQQLTKDDYDNVDKSRKLGFHHDYSPTQGLIPRTLVNIFYESEVVQRLVFHPRVLDVLQAIIGSQVRFYNSRCFLKPPGGLGTAWHRDIEFFDARPNPIVNTLLFLDEQTIENGCLRVVPTSHRTAKRGRLDIAQEFPEVALSEADTRGYKGPLPGEVPLVCPAGSLVLVDHFTLHGSEDNRSNSSRRLLSLGYSGAYTQDNNGIYPSSILIAGSRLPHEGPDYTTHVYS